jgi:hypothetical protein
MSFSEGGFMGITNFFQNILKKFWRSPIEHNVSTGGRTSLLSERHPGTYDVFISHASEDKAQVALPLAAYLERQGFRVWLDVFELTIGDSLRRRIDQGLSASRFGVVILSPDFLRKVWTNEELDGLVARQEGKHKVILPTWHNLSHNDILSYSPMLAGKVAVSTTQGLEHVARAVVRAMELSRSDNSDPPSSPLRTVPLEEQRTKELSELRKQMIAAQSFIELQEVLYKVDEFLTRYPKYPEARSLKKLIMDIIKLQYPGSRDIKHIRHLLQLLQFTRRKNLMYSTWWIIGTLLAAICGFVLFFYKK